MNNKTIWITWEVHRRTRELAKAINADLYEYADKKNRLLRYIIYSVRTITVLLIEKPKILIVQNPSIILTLLVTIIKPILGYYLVVDRHSNFKLEYKYNNSITWTVYRKLSKYTLISTNLTIVTNKNLKNYIDSIGGNGFILQDKLPNIEINNKNTFTKCDVVFICSYGMDECFLEFIKAAAYFPEYTFGITGSYHRAVASGHIMPEAIPINLRLTGFLNENEYISLLGSASVIVVITTQENTLNCGAYEAVALGKPMILGDTDAIRSYFNKGSVYVNGSVESFCLGLEQTFRNLEMLRRDVICLKYELESDWNCRFKNFIETINRESGIKM